MMLVLAAAYVSVIAVPTAWPALTGLTAAIVGVLLATTYRMEQGEYPGSPHPGDCARLHWSRGGPRHQRSGDCRAGRTGRSVRAPALEASGIGGHVMILDLFTRCVLISLLAFGGGGAALPLIERIAVAETGWVSAQDFATAVAFGSITPGPVLITMTFLGYRMAGLAGAFAATFGIFVMPWALATAAHLFRRWMQHPLLRHFGRGAAPAVVGLLVVAALHLSRSAFTSELHMSVLPLWPWGWRYGRN